MEMSSVTTRRTYPMLVIGALLLAFVATYASSLSILVAIWAGQDDTIYQYGFLVLACTLYIIYSKREKLIRLDARPFLWALPALLLFSVLWAIGIVVDIQSLHLAVLPPLLLTLVLLVLGWSYLWQLLIPIGLLAFAVPMWWPLLPYLQQAATLVTEISLQLIGIPVFVEGYILRLPGGAFIVEEGCAGLNFLLVSVILSLICVELFHYSWRRAIALVSSAVVLALIANWIRVLVIVLIGNYTNMQSSLVQDHYNLGWLIYCIVTLIPLLLLNHRLQLPQPIRTSVPAHTTSPAALRGFPVILLLVAGAMLLTGPLLVSLNGSRDDTVAELALPGAAPGWLKSTPSARQVDGRWRPVYSNPSAQYTARYDRAGRTVDTYLIYYARQTQGAEVINSENAIADEAIWTPMSNTASVRTITLASSHSLSARSVEIRTTGGARKLVWYWYLVGGYPTASPWQAKLLQVWAELAGRADAAAYLLASDCADPQCRDAEALLTEFLASHPLPGLP